MLKLKLQSFGHLMQKAGSLDKTLMLRKNEGRRRRGQQRIRWLDGITRCKFEQTQGDSKGQGTLLQFMGSQRVAQSCPTLCDPTDYSTPGLPVPHHLPKFAHIHVHCISDAIQPSHPLMPAFLLPSIFSSIRDFATELALLHQMTKILELQLQHQSF